MVATMMMANQHTELWLLLETTKYVSGFQTHLKVLWLYFSSLPHDLPNFFLDETTLLKKFDFGPLLVFDCKVHLLPSSGVPLIACGADDGGVHLFSFQSTGGELGCVKNLKIPGHEDWVRALEFTVEGRHSHFSYTL